MKYCKRCLYPANHPYGMIFDKKGICAGCKVHEEKDFLDWDERFKLLKDIVKKNNSKFDKSFFDCIVPVTGGGDSYFTVYVVKEKLGLNPLLVNYNHQYNTHVGIKNLANLTTVFDCELIQSTLSPELVKKITKHTIKKYGSIYWHVLAGYTTFPVKVAVRFRIPLIIWGVNPWAEQTGMYSHLDEMEMTERCRKEHGLMGISTKEIFESSSSLSYEDLNEYRYPSDYEIEEIGVRGIYLSNYLRWDSKKQHELMIKKYGYESAAQQRTFNTYEDVHCAHSAGLHDYLKFLKLGYSKVTDHATREIRLKRMTREEGIEMVEKYSNIEPKDLELFLKWIGMNKNEFFEHINKYRDSSIWYRDNQGNWNLKDSIINHKNDKDIESVRLKKSEDCNFLITQNINEFKNNNSYLLMGRSYLDQYNYGALLDRPEGEKISKREWKSPDISK
mgnify:CR=1 FL=1|tara:strand:+ start:1153 stop:2490 length:1338 start_codon:yes stop_codon:yes gene_type:complete